MIDDRDIARPPYEGPNDEPLPDRELTEEELDEMLRKLFPEQKKKDSDGD